MTVRRAEVIGFVGGVGSGKSALARWAGEHLGGIVLDADAAGHRALDRPEVKESLRKEFGDGVFDEEGTVIRSRLAARVFGDGEPEQTARRQLERIVHPVIGRDLEQQIAEAGQASNVILLDAAVLLEAGWQTACDAVVFVDVPEEVRRRRVQQTRGWTAEELTQREASQWPLDAKRQSADVVIDNSESLEAAGRQFLTWHERWRRTRLTGGGRHDT